MKTLCMMTSVHPHDDVRIFRLEALPLARAGWQVVILNREFEGKKEGVFFRRVELPVRRLGRMGTAAGRFWRAARQVPADLYQLHDPELLPAGWALARKGKRVVYDAHEDLPRQLLDKGWIPSLLRPGLSRAARWGEERLTRKFVCCLGATPEIARRFPQGRVFRNFPLPEEFPAGPDPASRPRQALYLGSITRERGLFTMLEAVEAGGIPLLLAGRMESGELSRQAADHPGWSMVRWMGLRSREELPALMDQCRMGLLLLQGTDAYRRSMPIKLFEYQMAGLPVVASDFPLWRQLTQEKGVLFVPPGDARAAAQAIRRLAQEDDLVRRLGREGRELAMGRFDGRREQERLVSLWNSLVLEETQGREGGLG